MPAYSEDLYRKYIGVHNLAERGSTDGERAAAGNARVKLEEKYPGIGLEALRWQEAQERAARGEPPPQPPPPKAEPFGAYTAASGNWGGAEPSTPPPGAKPGATPWGSWTDVLGTAFKAAQGFTETVINAEAGKQYAEACVAMEEGKTRSGMVRLTAVVPFADLVTAKARLNDAQKQAFARSIGERISARVYAFLAS